MAKGKNKILFTSNEWEEEDLLRVWNVIDKIAKEKYNLDYYAPKFVIVDYETMLINQSFSGGLPLSYSHWSQGKHYFAERDSYVAHKSGLAYELIINSDPSMAYMLDTNTLAQQTEVMGHASVGHAAFFKNNYAFKEGIDPHYILPLLEYAKEYVSACESKYGATDVEEILDYAHALSLHSVDRSVRRCNAELVQRQKEYNDYLDENYSELYAEIDKKIIIDSSEEVSDITYPEHNLLYFIEKTSTILASWEKEILYLVRTISQYFYPQRITKLMNEGYATFWHYTLIHDLYDQGYIEEWAMLEMLDMHCGVVYTPDNHADIQINPYKLGSSIFFDIKRMCENPTDEDREYFPDLVGKDWQEEVKYAMENFNDASFILQYLSPKVVRDLGFVCSEFKSEDDSYMIYQVNSTQSDEDFFRIRRHISENYDYHVHIPEVFISGVDEDVIKLHYRKPTSSDKQLEEIDTTEILSYIQALTGKEIECSVEL